MYIEYIMIFVNQRNIIFLNSTFLKIIFRKLINYKLLIKSTFYSMIIRAINPNCNIFVIDES